MQVLLKKIRALSIEKNTAEYFCYDNTLPFIKLEKSELIFLV